ncbi:MAG TPA: mismatch-specific DNA-glycosylase [Nitrospiraceae bacterium]|nr:mismatch-specific DNA-glycosylase [Nitrospiraceae bacterium]
MVLPSLNRLSNEPTEPRARRRAQHLPSLFVHIAHPCLPDYLAPDLRALFVGINPGLRSSQVGHHYAGPSNRFWKLLYEARLVPEPITFREDARLLDWGLGLTNLVGRPTASSKGLTAEDYAAGRRDLMRKVRRWRPKVLVLLGLTIYPILFSGKAKGRPELGLQEEKIYGSALFLLPNPSGRNASYAYATLLKGFRHLARYITEK